MKKTLFLVCAILFSLFLTAGEEPVTCEGVYPQHLQDLYRDADGSLYWSFTNRLIKTDSKGNFLCGIAVPGHHGGLTIRDGLLYVAVCYITDWSKGADYSEIFVYRPENLEFVKKYPFPDAKGIDGIEKTPDGFAIAPDTDDPDAEENWVYEYTPEFKLIAKHAIHTGPTYTGVQSIKATENGYLLACYDYRLALVAREFKLIKLYEYDASCGFLVEDADTILAARHFDVIQWEQYRARLQKVNLDALKEVSPLEAKASAEQNTK